MTLSTIKFPLSRWLAAKSKPMTEKSGRITEKSGRITEKSGRISGKGELLSLIKEQIINTLTIIPLK